MATKAIQKVVLDVGNSTTNIELNKNNFRSNSMIPLINLKPNIIINCFFLLNFKASNT